MPSPDNQITVGAVMVAIAVVAVMLAVVLALREEPLVPDPPYVPPTRPRTNFRDPILIACFGLGDESAKPAG